MNRHDAVTRSYVIPGQTWPSELCWLYDTVSRSRHHAEVGVFCGRSLFASCMGMKSGTVLAVDQERPVLEGAPSLEWTTLVLDATVEAIRKHNKSLDVLIDNTGSLASARAYRGEKFDSVFIDAGHEYEFVSGDILEWKPLVRYGGVLCGHDYSTAFPGVMDAVNELCPGFQVVPNTRIWWITL